MSEPGERLRDLRIKAGYDNAVDFARRYGINEFTYRAHEGGVRGIKADMARRYARIFGVPTEWLLYGEGDAPDAEAVKRTAASRPCQEATAIPEIDIRAGMGGGGEAPPHYVPDGNGGMAVADDVCGEWTLPDYYLRSELRVAPSEARIIEVQGDSMAPTIASGERVMVNMDDTKPSPGGVFCIWDGIGIVVKRLEYVPYSDPPIIKIKSDNPAHDDYERTADEVKIVGRIIWAARRL